MFELILNRFDYASQEGAEILSAEELAAWPQGDVAALKRLKLVKKAAPAKIVECSGCEDACLMPVNVYPVQNGRESRIFIACDKREDTGRVPIEPPALEQWQIDISRFAVLLASALGTEHIPEEIIPQRAFYLGHLTINRKRRPGILIANEGILNDALESELFRQYAHPFFLVAAGLPGPQELKQGLAIPLLYILLPSKDDLTVDLAELDRILSTKSQARQDVIPIAVPKGTEWNQVFISFVNDQTVQIRYAGNTEHRSFDEMGFSDLRAATTESRPSDLWGIFRQVAHLNGEVSFQDSVQKFKDPEKLKKWVSQIRKKLKAVFPDITNDPFHPYKKVKGYKTRFSLNVFPPSM